MRSRLNSPLKKFEKIYPLCRSILDSETWDRIIVECDLNAEPETFLNKLLFRTDDVGFPEFLPELARLELTINKVIKGETEIPLEPDQPVINPTLQLLQLSWKNLVSILNSDQGNASVNPEPGEEWVLIWRNPVTVKIDIHKALEEDLLVLKMTFEEITPEQAASVGNLPIGAIDAAIDRAISKGILLAPKSLLRRDPAAFPAAQNTPEHFLTTPIFALQGHITHVCDLHCKHCYDRSNRSTLRLEQSIGILDDLRAFCKSRNVRGQVSFTGGNPLLYPRFSELYSAAVERGFVVAILGNPAPKEMIEGLIAIQPLSFFQVSLEGLQEHNDAIRGAGHFERIMGFLKVLRELEVFSMVMLTLTKENIDHVLPLAEMLRGMTDSFTFNRLSLVGEGANLQLPSREKYVSFLESYVEAAKHNPVIDLKDNLLNIVHYRKKIDLFGGCTGYGCGAAFNFIAVLPDGEAHACRKFPSPIGNVLQQSIAEVYESDMARRYRAGCSACRSCVIRPVCGGCLSVAYSHGLNVFEERDPFCFNCNN